MGFATRRGNAAAVVGAALAPYHSVRHHHLAICGECGARPCNRAAEPAFKFGVGMRVLGRRDGRAVDGRGRFQHLTLLELFLAFALFCVDVNFEANTQGRGKHRDHTALEQEVAESADSAQRHCAGASV